jgi:L-lactate dehydrogenase (cytochrome)
MEASKTKQTDIAQGKDATEEFEPIHPPDTLDKYLDQSKHLGEVDMSTIEKEAKEESPEAVARNFIKKSAWEYY